MAGRRRAGAEQVRALGYVRVSTDEQADSGAGLEAQRAAIELAAAARGWELVGVVEDAGYSAKTLKRPGITRALEAVAAGDASALVVAKLDRLSRSVRDCASLLERAHREGWGLVALDLGVDTTSPSGELVANLMAAVAQWERRAIGQRTRDALAARRAAGVRLGRPPVLERALVARIRKMRGRGRSLRQIADKLNAEGIPTAQGGRCWHASTVRAVLSRAVA